MTRALLIGVIGGGREEPDVLALAEAVGQALAGEGAVVLTGGLGGVMAAASRGAAAAGGRVVALLPGDDPDAANPHVEIPIATGLGEARNAVIATAAMGLIAVGGETGTLSEIAHGLKLSRPVVTLSSRWDGLPGTLTASTPQQAVVLCLEAVSL